MGWKQIGKKALTISSATEILLAMQYEVLDICIYSSKLFEKFFQRFVFHPLDIKNISFGSTKTYGVEYLRITKKNGYWLMAIKRARIGKRIALVMDGWSLI